MFITAKCPNPRCGLAFPVEVDRAGKNLPCPACGQVITVRPEQQALALAAERARIAQAAANRSDRKTLPLSGLLDCIRSLWNVGSMFRTADAAGIERLILCGITGTPPRGEIAKTALGAEQVVPWTCAPDAAAAIRSLRDEIPGIQVIALEQTATSRRLARIELRAPCCLVVGNEVAGVSAPAIREADVCAHLPMRGIKGSLNVAVAFGIAAYQLAARLDG
jgi:tRNA G18 (ribose-2'-O)-methylase SpoU